MNMEFLNRISIKQRKQNICERSFPGKTSAKVTIFRPQFVSAGPKIIRRIELSLDRTYRTNRQHFECHGNPHGRAQVVRSICKLRQWQNRHGIACRYQDICGRPFAFPCPLGFQAPARGFVRPGDTLRGSITPSPGCATSRLSQHCLANASCGGSRACDP